VVGDGAGNVGLGYGKAKEVPGRDPEGDGGGAQASLQRAARGRHHHPHDHRRARRGACAAEARRARTGVNRRWCGAAPSSEAAGVHDVLAKSLGSSNAINVSRATINGLRELRRPEEIAASGASRPKRCRPRACCGAYRARNMKKTEVTEVA